MQELNFILEKVVEKAHAVELVKKQSIIMQLEDMQAGKARLKIAQYNYDFPSNKCCFLCGSSTHFANKWTVAKRKTCRKLDKEGLFTAVCKSKPQRLPVNLL